MYHVYILYSTSADKYYVGQTDNLEVRLMELIKRRLNRKHLKHMGVIEIYPQRAVVGTKGG